MLYSTIWVEIGLYMAEQYRFLFEEFELKKVDFDITESTLDFVVDTEKI
jgi:hypothetical protein